MALADIDRVAAREHWPLQRLALACLQWQLRRDGCDPGPCDGVPGPRTQAALDDWRLQHEPPPQGDDWRAGERPVEPDPGPPGRRIKAFELPYPLRLSWDLDTRVTRIRLHEDYGDSAMAALAAIAAAYSPEQRRDFGLDIFGGAYNLRHKRGGTQLSTHAYGLAIDFDPVRNPLRANHDIAFLARPECKEFLDIWEAHGWHSLGRARDYDWMHLQAVPV